ncbi:LAQU0S15e02102g1_1 [Lachancea quebecensis]|uniref:Phosphatidate cytidylyltransferase, mitochondrial n=1 Tax=Lachancea quebecensis TaxID=1654605 RepID=A0A0P1L3R0_9SACH|nr:LAQU0S15e02102g1_1 [Lachancea quebecensis]
MLRLPRVAVALPGRRSHRLMVLLRLNSTHAYGHQKDSLQPMVHGPIMSSTDKMRYDVSQDELRLLEQGIKKSDELTSQFTNYRYKFKKLPPNYGSNQLLTIDGDLQKDLNGVVGHFRAPVKYAFGYGSGVFQQSGYSKTQEAPQIDLILGVSHPEHFHSLNMRQNPHHYSSLRYFGSQFVSKFQEIGAGIYFNPFVDINGQTVKYGVVSMENLLKDVATWDSFYLAGRLQKPVKVLKNDLSVQYWNQLNLKAAATLAKHLMPQDPTKPLDELEFYTQITALSYVGDIRYKVGGENPDKVKNIVEKNFAQFQEYYKPIYKDVIVNNSHYLPRGFTFENSIQLLESRIFRTSTLQTLKGIFTAGITKSIRYAWAKKLKAMKRKSS